jgi:hypothetical protein
MPDINRAKTAERRIVRCFKLLKHIKQPNRGKVREKSIYFCCNAGKKSNWVPPKFAVRS